MTPPAFDNFRFSQNNLSVKSKLELFNADCLSVFRKLPRGSVDLILCDPPYGTTDARWDSVIPLRPMWSGIERIIGDKNCMVLLFGKNPFTAKLIASNNKRFSYDLIWEKSNIVGMFDVRRRPMCKYEIISVFRYGQNKYFPQCKMKPHSLVGQNRTYKTKERFAANQHRVYHSQKNRDTAPPSQGFPHDILRFPNIQHRLHSTEKPTKLLMHLIESYSRPGETVLDFCMGSGSTAIAAMATGRNFIGMELEKNIFDKASRRIELYEKQLATLGKM